MPKIYRYQGYADPLTPYTLSTGPASTRTTFVGISKTIQYQGQYQHLAPTAGQAQSPSGWDGADTVFRFSKPSRQISGADVFIASAPSVIVSGWDSADAVFRFRKGPQQSLAADVWFIAAPLQAPSGWGDCDLHNLPKRKMAVSVSADLDNVTATPAPPGGVAQNWYFLTQRFHAAKAVNERRL